MLLIIYTQFIYIMYVYDIFLPRMLGPPSPPPLGEIYQKRRNTSILKSKHLNFCVDDFGI